MTTPSPLIFSPQEYLEAKQRAAMRENPSLSPLAFEVGDVLASGLHAALSEEQRGILRELQVAIGVLPYYEFDAYTEKTPSGNGRIVCYSYGLMSFLLVLNKILLCRVTLPFQGFEPTIDPQAALGRVREAMNWFYRKTEPPPPFPRFTLDTQRTLIASTLAQTQAVFIIGHELAHVVTGHLDGPGPKDTAEARQWEFEADERGVEMALSSFRRRNDLGGTNELALAQAGIDIVFTYFQFIADYYGNTYNDPNHPSPEARRQHFRTRYGLELPELAKDLGDQAAALFAWFGQNIHLIEDAEPVAIASDGQADSAPGRRDDPPSSPLRDALVEIAELAGTAVGKRGGD